jgi:large subunit ribosomal protein L18
MAQESVFERRKRRVRHRLAHKSRGRVRLSVFRSNRYVYAQLIDDGSHSTLVAASSLEKDFRTTSGKTADCTAAHAIGKLIGERALAKGIKEVVFDRGGYLFHGRIKALAEGARSAGLSF